MNGLMELVLLLDVDVTRKINSLAQRAPLLDKGIVWLTFHNILRGGVVVALLWGAWYSRSTALHFRKGRIVESLAAIFIALLIAQVLQNMLPYRARPLHDPMFAFAALPDVGPSILTGWSSFPSDHAVLFFALSTATFLINRPLGVVSFLWSAVVICLPRIYIGAHWPSDLIVGAAIGVLVTMACFRLSDAGLFERFRRFGEAHPAIVMPALFLVSMETARLFNDVRSLGAAIRGFASHILS